MKGTMNCIALTALGLALLAGPAAAEVTFEMIGTVLATDISADGTVVVGNTQNYETFRWTAAEGVVLLGMNSTYAGSAAGTPDVSDDGLFVSATILGADSTYVTQGLWSEATGWVETMPPPPADGGLMDSAYGSAWGLSGDGSTLVGLYWRPGQAGGLAHASAWTAPGPPVDLGSQGSDSRGNAASFDGSVVAGWSANGFGTWQPTVWVNGVMTVLEPTEMFCDASLVSADGSKVYGHVPAREATIREGAIWTWDGEAWQMERFGYLPGTAPEYGLVLPEGVTADGSLVVGYNRFSNPTVATGFMWTAEGGMVDVEDYLADNGIEVPAGFDIRSLSGVSADGRVMVGIGQDMVPPFNFRSFIIRDDTISDVPDVAGGLRLDPAYPNPFNPSTTIPVTLDRGGEVSVEVFDARGSRIRTLHHGGLAAGRHEFTWDGRDERGAAVPSGVYLARVGDPSGRSDSRRLVLLK